MANEFNGSPDLFIDKPPEFAIVDGIGRITVVSGSTKIIIRCTPHVILAGSADAMRVYVEWDAARADEPLPFKKL
jgi:hypothetical protein